MSEATTITSNRVTLPNFCPEVPTGSGRFDFGLLESCIIMYPSYPGVDPFLIIILSITNPTIEPIDPTDPLRIRQNAVIDSGRHCYRPIISCTKYNMS